MIDRSDRENWRMPPLALLPAAGRAARPQDRHVGAAVPYLAVATVLVAVKIVQLALAH